MRRWLIFAYTKNNIFQFLIGATTRTGAVLVHEMGHSFGLGHINDGRGQNCPCSAEQCVMDAVYK